MKVEMEDMDDSTICDSVVSLDLHTFYTLPSYFLFCRIP